MEDDKKTKAFCDWDTTGIPVISLWLPLRAYIFTSTSGKSIVCFVEEAPVVLVRTYLSTEGVVRVGHSKLETVGKFYCISCAL